MMSSASSQVMGSQASFPRSSRARFKGLRTRFSLYIYSGSVRQRTHRRPWVMGWSGSPSTSTTLPSLTVRYMPHPTGWSPGGDQAQVRHLTTPSPHSIIRSDITSPLSCCLSRGGTFPVSRMISLRKATSKCRKVPEPRAYLLMGAPGAFGAEGALGIP